MSVLNPGETEVVVTCCEVPALGQPGWQLNGWPGGAEGLRENFSPLVIKVHLSRELNVMNYCSQSDGHLLITALFYATAGTSNCGGLKRTKWLF